MEVNGEPVLSDQSGIYSEIRTSNAAYSTRKLVAPPKITTQKDKVMVTGISYGEDKALINEAWTFFITETDIRLSIERTVSKPFVAEEVSFPSVNFNSIHTWDGAFLGHGGLAWFTSLMRNCVPMVFIPAPPFSGTAHRKRIKRLSFCTRQTGCVEIYKVK